MNTESKKLEVNIVNIATIKEPKLGNYANYQDSKGRKLMCNGAERNTKSQ